MEDSFGARIKSLRNNKNLSQQKVASALDITQEHDYIETNFSLIRKIANYFNVTTDYLLGVETSKEEVAPEFSAEQLQVVNLVKKLNNKELEKVYNYLLGIIDARS